ncbi:hypothetical protein [Pirellula sp. SH-Sr6A]|uniref:hypothetical protein n=1 Tax=Pirellula sp. SH-Sr6A TaxID=1632865 RepID=UPI0011BA8E6B|nr:hypothetical protein [Pirellula sp. SH-Sr6A]
MLPLLSLFRTGHLWPCIAILVFSAPSAGQEAPSDSNSIAKPNVPFPEKGIAARYPGDQGIQKDPLVIFAEDFEIDSIDDLRSRWETVRDPEVMTLDSQTPDGGKGAKSLLIAQRQELGTGADLYRRLDAGYERIFARMMVRFADDCEPIHHFGTCLGGNYPSTAWPSVRAGEPTRGDKAFWVGIEPFGKSWRWDYYTYWHAMRGSPPRGQTWGNSFIQDPKLTIPKEKWICVETMVQMNDIGKKNGEMALWIDGTLVSHLGPGFPVGKWVFDKFLPGEGGEGVRWNPDKGDREYLKNPPEGTPFEGFEFRTIDQLNVNFVWLYVYITQGTKGHANRVWFDDVVVAKQYIGPPEKGPAKGPDNGKKRP